MARKKSRQAKLARKSQKDAKKERRQRHQGRGLRPPSLTLLSGLDEAEDLLQHGDLEEAVEVLEELRKRYPRRVEVLGLMLDAYDKLQDLWSYQATLQRLTALTPHDEEVWLALGGAALANGQMATARRAFGHLLTNWPENPHANQVRTTLAGLEELLLTECAKFGLPREAGIDVLILHDEVNLHLNLGNYEQVCQTADRLLRQCPIFAPALNNRSQAHFMLGRINQAIADARRVLEFDANNFHALSNLSRFLFLSGQFEDAQLVAERLKIVQSESPDLYVKQAEALAFLGDWPGILEALQKSETSKARDLGADVGLIYYLAGIAAAELNQSGLARKYWKRAVKWGSVAGWAEENLDDLRLPVGERNSPWAFPINYWIPQAVIERLIAGAERGTSSARGNAGGRPVRKFFEEHAYLERLMPVLLERGDAAAREFVIRVASISRLPSIMSALQEFAFGQRGSDELRYQAALQLVEAEALTPGNLRMWRDGQWQETILASIEITAEPVVQLPPKLEQVARRAFEAINNEDGVTGERLLRQALTERPDDPSFLYNLATAIAVQGREEEAMEQIRDIHRRFPDYSFARMRLAQEAAELRDFETAHALLDPLTTRARFHRSEYAALCMAQIDVLMAEGKKEGASTWLNLWRDVDPDDHRLKFYERRIKQRGLLGGFFRPE